MTFTKRNMSRSFYRSFVFLISPPSVSGLSEAQYTNLSPSSSPHRQLLVKYLTTDSSSLELKEESYAKKIRRAILKVCDATVEDVVQSLRSDQSCCSIQLTPNLVDSLLHRFGDDWKSALGFFKWAGSQSGYKHTLYACDRMVDLLGKMKQTDRMWDLVHELRSEGLVTLETVAKIMRRLAGAGRWKDTVKLFDDLETMGFDKDTRSMNILLDTLCKEKRVEVAREAFSVLKSHIPPDAFTFNIFVHGWCGARRIDEAMWTIEEMKKWGLRPSVITYSTILQAYCNQHKFQEVYDLLDRMVVEGCLPNVVTYTTIMNSLANSGKLEEALGVVKRMKSSGCELDILFYNSLINILGKAGRLREAAHIFDIDMQRNGIRRNLSTYNTMISIFCHNCQEQNALNVLKEMENLSLKLLLKK
ncbi:small ribosomal subunit protein mL104 (rPPR9) [Elaeis guineensis]|uniref:Pentatricopeptide repeat-containing protein At3g04130, mitochondrial n=1 Tax=Elaeis guineensis var. tenera TaxID=51953 RepID=A0A8N4EWT3_ELAGV|nr:pentatricopeptide repeat-containing protein At3g04130, mitochondrial [Elaeis guineensis]